LLAALVGCSSTAAPAVIDDGDGGVDAAAPPPPAVIDAAVADGGSVEDASHLPLSYTNPVFAKDFPDPFVLRDGSSYYAFATNAAGKNVRVARSTDLATWTELPDALPALPSWARAHASLTWAPAVLKRGSTYILYFTARDNGSNFQCIGHAVSASPAGPYVDDSTEPFVCQVEAPQALCGSIDPSTFEASNGDLYLLWKSDENASACGDDARLWTQRMGIDGLSLLGSPTALLKRDRPWEAPLIEGPTMVTLGGLLYLFYSANWWESTGYGIGYAICDTPIGPCSKKTLDGPLIGSKGDTLGPGGQEIFTDAQGKLWMAYHAWSAPIVGYDNGGSRTLRIDPLELVGGVPSLAGPSTTPRPL